MAATVAVAPAQLPSTTNPIPFKPEPVAHIPWLEKCSNIAEVNQIHAQMIKTGHVHQTIPASKLLTSLCKTSAAMGFGATYPLQFFERIREPNTFMWNTIIRALSHSQNQEEAIILYCQMLHNASHHNLHTFPFLIKACTLEELLQLHCHIIKFGFASELHTANSLLHAYAKSGRALAARRLFGRMPSRDAVSWNSMIDCYAQSGNMEAARSLFDGMQERNVITWTVMINGYVQSCLFEEALKLFREMQGNGVDPDKVTVASAISACAQLGDLDQGRWIHTYIKRKRIRLDQTLRCVLVDMYAKCGEIDEAVAIFEKMEGRGCVSLWTAMITGFAVHGRGREAINLFEDMERRGVRPNEITFTGLLTACSYSGLVGDGKALFEKMEKCYQIRPSIEHYGCMVDLLSRAGLLKEAEDLIAAMAVKPNAAVWGALLTGCLIHRDYDRGVRIGNILIALEPSHGGRYVNLANNFAGRGEWNRAAMIRRVMKERDVCKLPGSSLISLDGKTHEFFAER